MALDALAIVKWSAKSLVDLRDAHVYKLMTNQDYADEIRYAAAVKIFMAAHPSTAAYTRDSTTVTYERLTPSEQVFIVDQRKYWGIKVDDLEKHLALGGGRIWEEEIRNGTWELADDVDDFINDLMATATPTDNTLAARTLGLGLNANAYDLLVDMSVTLKKNNVPQTMLHVAVPPAFVGLLYKDERFVSFNTERARQLIRGEPVGVVQNLTIHETNNVTVSGTTYTIQAAWEKATTYGEQLNDIQYFEKFEGTFDQGAREELVFGGKVTQPQGLVKCNVQFAA